MRSLFARSALCTAMLFFQLHLPSGASADIILTDIDWGGQAPFGQSAPVNEYEFRVKRKAVYKDQQGEHWYVHQGARNGDAVVQLIDQVNGGSQEIVLPTLHGVNSGGDAVSVAVVDGVVNVFGGTVFTTGNFLKTTRWEVHYNHQSQSWNCSAPIEVEFVDGGNGSLPFDVSADGRVLIGTENNGAYVHNLGGGSQYLPPVNGSVLNNPQLISRDKRWLVMTNEAGDPIFYRTESLESPFYEVVNATIEKPQNGQVPDSYHTALMDSVLGQTLFSDFEHDQFLQEAAAIHVLDESGATPTWALLAEFEAGSSINSVLTVNDRGIFVVDIGANSFAGGLDNPLELYRIGDLIGFEGDYLIEPGSLVPGTVNWIDPDGRINSRLTSVPEPGSALLLGSIFTLAALRRRR